MFSIALVAVAGLGAFFLIGGTERYLDFPPA